MLGNFGKFALLEKLAEGGMAEVFRATARNSIGQDRVVAVKRLHRALCEDHELTEMLVDEFRIAIQLDHPGICSVFDLGMYDNQSFIIMEFIDGVDVQYLIERFNMSGDYLPTNAALHIMSKTLDALQYAHTRKNVFGEDLSIVHRDVSPQNVMVDLYGKVKLVDFGIAKAKDRLNETQHGIIKGKYFYMSPEQAHAHHVDARTDIFSAGMVLYECMVGQSPYLNLPDVELLKTVRRAGFPPPSHFRPDIDPGVAAIIRKATERSAKARFQSAAEFKVAVDTLLMRLGGYSGGQLAEITQIVANPSESGEHVLAMSRGEYRASTESLVFELPSESVLAKLSGENTIANESYKPNPFADEDATQIYNRPSIPQAGFGQKVPPKQNQQAPPPKKRRAVKQKSSFLDSFKDPRFIWVIVMLAVFLVVLALFVVASKRNQTPPEVVSVETVNSIATDTQNVEVAVAFNTDPPNASLYVDGEEKGTTPVSIELESDKTYAIEFIKDGYEVARQELKVEKDQPDVMATLGEARGVLKIMSYPSEAEILIDGESQGKTPLSLTKLETDQEYELIAVLGKKREKKKVEWSDDDSSVKEVMFEFKGAPSREIAMADLNVEAEPEPKDEPKKVEKEAKKEKPKTVAYKRKTPRKRTPKAKSSKKEKVEEDLNLWGGSSAKKEPKKEPAAEKEVEEDLDLWGGSKKKKTAKKKEPKKEAPKKKKKKKEEEDEKLDIW